MIMVVRLTANAQHFFFLILMLLKQLKTYTTDLYKEKTRRKHPILKPIQYKNVYESLSSFCDEWGTGYDGLTDMMCKFFKQ